MNLIWIGAMVWGGALQVIKWSYNPFKWPYKYWGHTPTYRSYNPIYNYSHVQFGCSSCQPFQGVAGSHCSLAGSFKQGGRFFRWDFFFPLHKFEDGQSEIYQKNPNSFCETSVNVVSFFKGQYCIYFVPSVVIFSRTSRRNKINFCTSQTLILVPTFRCFVVQKWNFPGVRCFNGLISCWARTELSQVETKAHRKIVTKNHRPKKECHGDGV